MLRVGVVSCEPDSIIWDNDSLVFCRLRLAPFEVEYVVRDVVPLDSTVLRVVELLVDPAWLIIELGTGGP